MSVVQENRGGGKIKMAALKKYMVLQPPGKWGL